MALDIPLPTASPADDPLQYIPLVLSAIEGFLLARDVWEADDYPEAYSYMQELMEYLVVLMEANILSVTYPKTCFLLPNPNVRKIAGAGTFTLTTLTALQYGIYGDIVATASGNHYEYDVLIDSGVWKFWYMAISYNGGGNVRFMLDGVEKDIRDFYTAVQTLNNVVVGIPTQNILTPGNHTIGFLSNTKNAASSSFGMRVQAVMGLRQGDLP